MKEWWINLGLREKQTLSVGGLFLILLLLYEIIWAPISNHNDNLRSEIARNQKLLIWMQEANQRAETMQKMLQSTSSAKTSAALLNLLQKQIKTSPFENNLLQMTQAENNAVQLSFQKVNFDALIKWLTVLWKNQGLTVKQITVTPNGPLGVVDVTVQVMA
jgi:type II secretory pathway component PulM